MARNRGQSAIHVAGAEMLSKFLSSADSPTVIENDKIFILQGA